MCVSLGPPNIHCNVSWHFENTLFPLSKVTLNVLSKDFLVNTIKCGNEMSIYNVGIWNHFFICYEVSIRDKFYQIPWSVGHLSFFKMIKHSIQTIINYACSCIYKGYLKQNTWFSDLRDCVPTRNLICSVSAVWAEIVLA